MSKNIHVSIALNSHRCRRIGRRKYVNVYNQITMTHSCLFIENTNNWSSYLITTCVLENYSLASDCSICFMSFSFFWDKVFLLFQQLKNHLHNWSFQIFILDLFSFETLFLRNLFNIQAIFKKENWIHPFDLKYLSFMCSFFCQIYFFIIHDKTLTL